MKPDDKGGGITNTYNECLILYFVILNLFQDLIPNQESGWHRGVLLRPYELF